ncbi:MAG: transposase [Hyphomicrobiales bacterium]|nr:MAG: transposase [Hyphomicrobiales bacterium]
MGRRSFSREFKLEAVRLVRDRGVSIARTGPGKATLLRLFQHRSEHRFDVPSLPNLQTYPPQKMVAAEHVSATQSLKQLKQNQNLWFALFDLHADNQFNCVAGRSEHCFLFNVPRHHLR